MKKTICGILVGILLITMIVPTCIGEYKNNLIINPTVSSYSPVEIKIYENNFENGDEWTSGSNSGPDLWHITTIDSWSGDAALGCFRQNTKHYVNNMDFNYVLSPEFSLEDALDMKMDFYCKFITEDSDDHWGIVLYDPGTKSFLPHVWNATYSWQHLPYETYGYHKLWMGPMQPMSVYDSFNIKDAYDNWFSLGYFRDSGGKQIYNFKIGFVFYESDEIGYVNEEAEAHGDYWSGLFIDDVSIKILRINNPPADPEKPTGSESGIIGTSYEYSTETIDPEDDMVKYGWDWNGDGTVDEWTGYFTSGTTIDTSHTWTSKGTYYVKVKAEDSFGEQSDFSLPLTVVISDNSPPNKPGIPTGTGLGKPGISYSYYAYTTDPDGDKIYYMFDWGDGTNSNWIGKYDSGQTVIASHVWSIQGTFSVKVKAKDIHEVESVWSDPLAVSMPRSKTINHPLLNMLFEKFPLFQRLLKL